MASSKPTSIVLGGDIVLDSLSYHIDQRIKDIFQQADYAILNLEAPITSRNTPPVSKAGPSLSQDISVIKYINELGVKYLSGANNHLMDYGVQGLQDTIQHLAHHQIQFAGCGTTVTQAKMPLQLDDDIALLCMCEEEFGIANTTEPGCYSMYPDAVIEQIQQLTAQGKLVIIYPHGGGEMIPVPSDYIVQRYRQFIDAGAAAVIGHHPHIPQGIEKYQGGLIVYSLGNFMHRVYPNSWGMVMQLTIAEHNIVEYKPYYVQLQDHALTIIEQTSQYEDYIAQVSAIMTNPTMLLQIQQEQANAMYDDFYKGYLDNIFKQQPLWMRLYRRLRLSTKVREREQALSDEHNRNVQLHLQRNKSHAEFIATAQGLEQHTLTDERTTESNQLYRQLAGFIQQSTST